MIHSESLGEQKKHEDFMEEALALARLSMEQNEGTPFGAVVVRNGKIIGKGRNKTLALFDPTAHSEVVAIRDACKNLRTLNLSDCILYASSEPCPMCMGAIYLTGIKQIFYTTSGKDAAAYGFMGLNLKHAIQDDFKSYGLQKESINREKGIQVFKEWKQHQVDRYLKW